MCETRTISVATQFCANLKRLRKGRRLTQTQFGKRIGESRDTVGRWERGVSEPNLEQLAGLARAFEVTVDQLLGLGELTGNAATAVQIDLPKIGAQLQEIVNAIEGVLAPPAQHGKKRGSAPKKRKHRKKPPLAEPRPHGR